MYPQAPANDSPWWTLQRSDDCIVATAIHDGHGLRGEVAAAMRLAEEDRLREEDPHTGQAVTGVPTHLIARRSRFEIDLNRGIDDAIYLTPEQSWGLDVWETPPDAAAVEQSRRMHRGYYAMLGQLLDEIVASHGRFVLLDVHSYNHRRDGAEAPAMPRDAAPDINIGTFSMPRQEWAFLLDPLMEAMRGFDFNGRRLDVRENIAFQGKGEQTRFVHARYPSTGCAIAIEFKKFYMDEWSGQPDQAELDAMRAFITHTADTARALLHG